jgi:hypothetical protein
MLGVSKIRDGSSFWLNYPYTWKAGAWKALEKGSTYPAEVGSEQRRYLESLRSSICVYASDGA